MLREVYDFTGSQVDRSDICLSFDGINLEVEVEDQNSRDGKVLIEFKTVVKFDWELDGVLSNYRNETSEHLFEQDAGDFLLSHAGIDHPFLNDRLKKFSVLFSDLGKLIVIARACSVMGKDISHNS